MGVKSNIQWTDATWNVAVGCTKVDADCLYCYMYRDSLGGTRYDPKTIRKTTTVFNTPLKLKTPSKIFVSSYTDFFHEAIDGFRNEAWDIIRRCPQHTFQILTKRPERIKDHLPTDWGEGWPNVWLGTSVGSQEAANARVGYLLEVPAMVRFLSCEPLHGEISLTRLHGPSGLVAVNALNGKGTNTGIEYYNTGKIHWVIVGGESGNDKGKYRYRPCELVWLIRIMTECDLYKVPVFVKQVGTYLAKKWELDDRHGGNIEEWPDNLQIRQFPQL